MKKESGLEEIKERVEDFEKNIAMIRKKGYGETNIRANYMDVMFKALGWDVRNKYEVDREFSQKDKSKEANTKKVDYAFKINGRIKFFVEAKEASVDLEHNKDAIYQAKRYAYSSNGKAPIVILTDFEEFRVFNVLTAPLYDNPDKQLLKSHSFQYTDYIEKWDLLWDNFSRKAVEKGSLDELRGTITKNTKIMDKDFLEQITNWREELAKNVAIRNKNLNVDEINEAVQRILDRLVFIRNLEDRGIEPENTLLDKTKKSENIYKSLIPIFNSLNTTYNGLLFKEHFSEDINVDDKTIHYIIRQMNYPVSPFQFDVIEPEILGRIYEKFLGSKIRLTDSHRAKIEEKIEVRKAGGVYYTPEYIVDYIVKNTVGKKIEGLTPDEIKEIKIVDPACGSGSFLIGAYNYLLEYHRQWYIKNKTNKDYKADWYKTKEDEIVVNLHKRGDILRNNIFGVDIDKEATEVAIMSLYLKMLDDGFDKGERDLFFVKGSVLPDMTDNVKCGNSLIGNDYFKEKLDYNMDELKEIRAFDWDDEFSKIKFDCVIGNPPYIKYENLDNKTIDYSKKKYICSEGFFDIFQLFLEKSYSLLNKNGLLGFIFPNLFLKGMNYINSRKYFFENSKIEVIRNYGDGVFDHVQMSTCVMIFKNEKVKNKNIEYYSKINEQFLKVYVDQNRFNNNNYIYTNENICEKLNDSFSKLKDIVVITRGLEIGKDKIIPNNKNSVRIIFGKDISRYQIKSYSYISNKVYEKFKKNGEIFKSEKIIIRETGNIITTVYDDTGILTNRSLYCIRSKNEVSLFYLLGVLNSKLIQYYYVSQFKAETDIFPKIRIGQVQELPIPSKKYINQNNYTVEYELLIQLTKNMVEIQKDLIKAKSENDIGFLNKQINILETQLNHTVYKIYNLTDDEIKIIEST